MISNSLQDIKDSDGVKVNVLFAEDTGLLGLRIQCLVWNPVSLEWDRMTQPIIDATNSELYLVLDDVEDKLDSVIALLQDSLSDYKISDMDTSADPSYFGYVNKSGKWYIMKKTDSTGQMRYVKGDSAYSTAWTAKAAQSYDTFDAIF